jgi:CheY-like chemotaxis protein
VISVLIGNAIRFTPTGYVKFLVACSDNAGKNGGKRGIRFSVQDSGVGISSEKLATLFEFATETTPESGKFSGVSLGLAVCKRIVSLMGGQIGVESEKGVGTTVSIEIPFQTADEDETHELQLAEQFPMQTTEILRNWNLNILLAEDDSINQSVTKLYLNRFGCRVDIAANGREAVERFKKTKYDLIFMDCEMPEMDGLAAVRAIRKIEGKKSHVPIIALTASTMKGDRTMCLTTGMDEHVVKPINRRIIKEILSKYHRPVPVPEEINAEASTTREC